MTKKKILFVITKSNFGGAQRYVYDLSTNLPKDTFEVAVAFGGTGTVGAPGGRLLTLLEKAGIKTIFVKNFSRDINPFSDILSFFELFQIFRREKPNVVHLNSSKAGGVGALAAHMAGVKKIVFTSHGLAWDEDRNIFAKVAIYLGSQLTFALCNDIITVSKDNHRRVSKSVLIYNGISKINFKSREEARRDIMGQSTQDTPWIAALGEFTRNKGLPYLVEAAALLQKRGFSFRMSIVGDGDDLPKIKKQAIESGLYTNPNASAVIDLPGFVPNFAENLPAYEIFILPSIKEGLPYVLLEAGQAGCATVASRIPGITDIIGNEGILVEPKNPEALSRAIEQLLQNDRMRNTLGEGLKERVLKEFSIQTMIEKTVELYRR